MTFTLKIIKIGDSAGVILPKELFARLGADVGSVLSVAATERGLELTPAKPDFETT